MTFRRFQSSTTTTATLSLLQNIMTTKLRKGPKSFIFGIVFVTIIIGLQLQFQNSMTGTNDQVVTVANTRVMTTEPKLLQQSDINITSTSLSTSESGLCLTDECFRNIGSRLSRAWPMKDHTQWCLQGSPSYQEGLLLVKSPKAASSTMAALAFRMANQHKCKKLQHVHRVGYSYRNRQVENSFMMSSVRNPAQREISHMSYRFSKRQFQSNHNEKGIISMLNKTEISNHKGKGGTQYAYTTMEADDVLKKDMIWNQEHSTRMVNPFIIETKIQQLLDQYDFMVVVERWEESIVALALLTGMKMGDIVLTSQTKQAGHYTLENKKCLKLINKSLFKTPKIQEFLKSDTYRAKNYADYVLEAAVNASLDRTIEESIGRQKFDTALAEYRRLYALAMDQCAHVSGNACSDDGKFMPSADVVCYYQDFGCGYPCVNAVLRKDEQQQQQQ